MTGHWILIRLIKPAVQLLYNCCQTGHFRFRGIIYDPVHTEFVA